MFVLVMFQQLCVCSFCLLFYSFNCLLCHVFVNVALWRRLMLDSFYVLMGIVKLFELLAGLVLYTQKDIIIMVVISVVLYLTDKGEHVALMLLLFLFQLSVQVGLLQGPHIATVTMAAYECNSVNFPEPPYPNEWVPDWCSDLPLLLCAVFSRPCAQWCDCLSVMPTSAPVCCVLKASCSVMWLFICYAYLSSCVLRSQGLVVVDVTVYLLCLPLLLCAVFLRPCGRWCDCLFVSDMPTFSPVCCVLRASYSLIVTLPVMPTFSLVCCVLKASCSVMWLFICYAYLFSCVLCSQGIVVVDVTVYLLCLPLLLCAVFLRPCGRWCDCLFVSDMPTFSPVCCVFKASYSLMWLHLLCLPFLLCAVFSRPNTRWCDCLSVMPTFSPVCCVFKASYSLIWLFVCYAYLFSFVLCSQGHATVSVLHLPLFLCAVFSRPCNCVHVTPTISPVCCVLKAM